MNKLMSYPKFNQYFSLGDIVPFFKGMFANRALVQKAPVEVSRLVTAAVNEIEKTIDNVALRTVKQADCRKYLFVHIPSDCQKLFFYECEDDANYFITLADGKHIYLYPDLLCYRLVKTTRKVPNMALYRKPYCAQLNEALQQRGFKHVEGTEFMQLMYNVHEKFGMNA